MAMTVLETPPATTPAVPAVDVYVAERRRLLGIANRILGSTAEAEDVVQEVWIRWQRTDRALVDNPPAFLTTATTRLAINVLQAARTRHEVAVTPWLEDVADPAQDVAADPQSTAERTDGVERALHLLLERLSPTEYAAYLLRIGFDYPYRRIAAVLGLSAANARQLVSRSHGHVRSARRRPVSSATHARLVRAFRSAAHGGELAELEALLAAGAARGRYTSDDTVPAAHGGALPASRSAGRCWAERQHRGHARRPGGPCRNLAPERGRPLSATVRGES